MSHNSKDLEPKKIARSINKRKFKLFNVKKDQIDYKVINYSILIVAILSSIVLATFIITQISDIVINPVSNFFSMITPFIIALVVAWLLSPIVERIQETRNMSRRKASMLVSVVGILLITFMILGILYASADTLVTFLSGKHNLWHYLTSGTADLHKDIEANINNSNGVFAMNVFTWAGEQIGLLSSDAEGIYSLKFIFTDIDQYVSKIFSFAYQYVIIATVAAFLLPEFRGLNKVFKGSIPKRYKEHGSDLLDIVANSFTSYMNGALKIASYIGFAMFSSLTIITLLANFVLAGYSGDTGALVISDPSQAISVVLIIIVFAILAAVTNLVPYVGPFIGGIPIVLLIFLTDKSSGNWITISVLISTVFIQTLESLFFQPVIMGRSTKIHPVLILMGLTIFGSLFGIVGLLISTPLLAVSKAVIKYYDDIYEIF